MAATLVPESLHLPVTEPALIVAIAMGIFLLAPRLAELLRLPGVIGVIVAGALVGPNALGILARSETIVLLGTVGILYLMFMAGLEIDLEGFRRHRRESLAFGALTFLLPQLLGTGVALLIGYSWATSILVASMFASHTLLAYPIAIRFGIAKNRAVTAAVGGTIITDTAALLVLAIVAASARGTLDAGFWVRLAVLLTAYVAAVWLGLPRLARWFFRRETAGAGAEYLFVLAVLFAGAYLAEVAGVEAIVGAFLVGLALNPLLPEHTPLTHRLHFFGNHFFIPFFLLSVGMLVDVRVLAGGGRAWTVMLAMTATVVATKWLAAKATERIFGYTPEEGWAVFGLSVVQAAATLAAALVGVEVGLLDDAILNGVILMILFTAVLGPLVVERYGRRLALRAEERPSGPPETPQRVLVPMANPASADALIDLALAIRSPDSAEPVYPLTVVPADRATAAGEVALAERTLSHAVAFAASAGAPVTPLIRVDHNVASGIARGVVETRASSVVIGWDGQRIGTRTIFGSVLDRLLAGTEQQVVVAKLGHPLNTTRRLLVLIPHASDLVPGFPEGVATTKRVAERLGAKIRGYTVATAPEPYAGYFRGGRPGAEAALQLAEDWPDALSRLRGEIRADDLVVVLSARPGAISWHPSLADLPSHLAAMVPESFLMIYLAEAVAAPAIPSPRVAVPTGLAPDGALLDVPGAPFPRVIEQLVASVFEGSRARELSRILIARERQLTTEILPGIVVPHARVPGLLRPVLLVATSREGIAFPHATAPARLLFVLLTPEEEHQEHLARLARIARFAGDPERVEALWKARTLAEAVRVLGADG